MKFVAQNKTLTVLFANLTGLFILIVFRSLIESFFVAAGVSGPSQYYEGSVYFLSGTSALIFLRYASVNIPKAVKWFRPGFYAIVEGLDIKLEQMSDELQGIDKRIEKKFKEVNTNLYHMDQKIDKIERARENRAKNTDNFRIIRRSKIVFLEKLSPDLHRFAIILTNSFIDFVLSVHSTGFYAEDTDGNRIANGRLNPDIIAEDLTCNALQNRQQSDLILGAEFSKLFFMYHDKKVQEYILYIRELLEAGDNYKHDRFQETSELFLSTCLECLHHIYVDFMNGVRAPFSGESEDTEV